MYNPHSIEIHKMFDDLTGKHAGELFYSDLVWKVLKYDDGTGNICEQIVGDVFMTFKR